jgi:hypothetical protein
MKTKIEIKSIFGKVLFTYEDENATIKKAVEKAIEEKVSLQFAYLRYANLRSADLRNAILSYADLRYSDLTSADLRYADLTSADLRSADLRNTDLRSADLYSADLTSADLRSATNKETAYIPLHCKWSFTILGNKIQIGCKEKTIEEWDLFFNSDEEFETNRNTEEFKQIQACYEACKSYLTFLNN